MLDLQDRLDELKSLGLYRRMRMVSGPQGPRVVLDGKPVLLLCSNNYLGLADHPRVTWSFEGERKEQEDDQQEGAQQEETGP